MKENESESLLALPQPIKEPKKDCLTIRFSQHRFDENNMPTHFIALIDTLRRYP